MEPLPRTAGFGLCQMSKPTFVACNTLGLLLFDLFDERLGLNDLRSMKMLE
jgi:hypothetical protein